MPNNKELLKKLGFLPKENESGIFYKKFPAFDNYIIEVDFPKTQFSFGPKIKSDSGTTQNFSQDENWVVLECVNRLLEKGYKPEDIVLEKTWKTGHGTSGRLDILVKKEKKVYLMIECKTWGFEFEKEFKKLQKDGGQLFTYFQQDNKAEYLILYTSKFDGKEINYKNEIVKIEEHYREAGSVKDFYDRWNKLSKSNGIFDDWVNAYEFQNKALTINDLKVIKQEDSSFIFNRFLEILRHNVVSDKPNAFNKIFTLFLCKIVDEDRAKDEQLHFQYLEGEDDNISFQKRLTDLYKRGMSELLEKEVVDMGDEEFNNKFGSVDEKHKAEFLKILTEIRLKKNNEFAFKEVFDDSSFTENAKVVKEVVELLQGYKLRYNKKHQYLGDFFELLLTTGLKQESGQFFTPVPVAKYIIRSMPIKEIIQNKISKGNPNDLIPFTIDYAAGSGHFLIESMESIQRIIDSIDESKLNPQSARKISAWKKNEFEWAFDYVYGIEKDYRLVKTAKVGCYLHGDGLAKVIHGDGLGTFDKTSEYRGKLKEVDSDFSQDNKQFNVLVSNPPYSVSAFKGNLDEENAKESFELFDRLTDQSSEIECLFVERTKQLLADNGLAGIILPSSMLSNTGIYTKTREIILKYFEIIGITELGSGTFMATGTNTVVLFLKRRNNYEWQNVFSSIEKFFQNYKDVTVNGIESAFTKYVKYVWGEIKFEDYIMFCENKINKNIEKHEIYKEYEKKLKTESKNDFLKKMIEREKEKLLYFILAYNSKIILTKSGQKKEEKKFLGYEFSKRRGYEGIHPIQGGKSIDECTRMYNSDNQEDETKANSYVYKAFLGNKDQKIHKSLEKNVFEISLINIMTFDRADFEKTISLTLKKKIKIESKWGLVNIGEVIFEQPKSKIQVGTAKNTLNGSYNFFTSGEAVLKYNDYLVDNENIYLSTGGNAVVKFFTGKAAYSTDTYAIKSNNESRIKTQFIFYFLENMISDINEFYFKGVGLKHLQKSDFRNIKIPLPSKIIQEKIITEIGILEAKELKEKEKEDSLKKDIYKIYSFSKSKYPEVILSNEIEIIGGGTPDTSNPEYWDGNIPWLSIADFKGDSRYVETAEKSITEEGLKNSSTKYLEKDDIIISARGTVGALAQLKIPMTFNQSCYGIKANKSLIPDYLYFALKFEIEQFKNNAYGAIFDTITTRTFDLIKIPLPSLSDQQKIVREIEKIEKLINLSELKLHEFSKQKLAVLKKYL